MSLYAEEGATIRGILKAKIENILESDVDRDMIHLFVPFVRLLKEISPTRTGEERKDLNVLYLTASSIYSLYYSFMIAVDTSREQSSEDSENLELIDESVQNFTNAMNEVSETFLTNLKYVISTVGNKDRATELFENTYDSLVEDVLSKFTM